MDAINEIKQLYYNASAKTILDDFARAIDLLKTLPDEASRERVAVYMEGLTEMRNEWRGRTPTSRGSKPEAGGRLKAATPDRKRR